jgi:hypothetical protein
MVFCFESDFLTSEAGFSGHCSITYQSTWKSTYGKHFSKTQTGVEN